MSNSSSYRNSFNKSRLNQRIDQRALMSHQAANTFISVIYSLWTAFSLSESIFLSFWVLALMHAACTLFPVADAATSTFIFRPVATLTILLVGLLGGQIENLTQTCNTWYSIFVIRLPKESVRVTKIWLSALIHLELFPLNFHDGCGVVLVVVILIIIPSITFHFHTQQASKNILN